MFILTERSRVSVVAGDLKPFWPAAIASNFHEQRVWNVLLKEGFWRLKDEQDYWN